MTTTTSDTRQDVLNELFMTRFRLDQLQKHARNNDLLTEEEYDLLNTGLNYYAGYVSYLFSRGMDGYPEQFPQTLKAQDGISREILQNTWAWLDEEHKN